MYTYRFPRSNVPVWARQILVTRLSKILRLPESRNTNMIVHYSLFPLTHNLFALHLQQKRLSHQIQSHSSILRRNGMRLLCTNCTILNAIGPAAMRAIRPFAVLPLGRARLCSTRLIPYRLQRRIAKISRHWIIRVSPFRAPYIPNFETCKMRRYKVMSLVMLCYR